MCEVKNQSNMPKRKPARLALATIEEDVVVVGQDQESVVGNGRKNGSHSQESVYSYTGSLVDGSGGKGDENENDDGAQTVVGAKSVAATSVFGSLEKIGLNMGTYRSSMPLPSSLPSSSSRPTQSRSALQKVHDTDTQTVAGADTVVGARSVAATSVFGSLERVGLDMGKYRADVPSRR